MNYLQNLNILKNNLKIKYSKKALTHNINNSFTILPFPTREPERAKFENGFNSVIGEFVRIISGKKLMGDLNIIDLIKNIVDKVEVNQDDRKYLEKLINQYLTNSNNFFMPLHPSIFKYFSLNEGDQAKGEKKIAHFLRDVLCEDNSIKYMFDNFDNNEVHNVISKLILNNLNDLNYLQDNITKIEYKNQLNIISKLFNEDITYLFTHKEYFLNNFYLLVAYYYFFYITQLSLKLGKMGNAKYDEITPIYYILDWEKASKSRQAYKKGYLLIKETNKQLIIHVNTLEHLNQIFGTNGKNYIDLEKLFNSIDENEQIELIKVLKIWINEYRYNMLLQNMDLDNKSYKELVYSLYKSLDEGIKPAIKSRYALSIKEIGNKFFLKRRGSLGNLLNINQKFLLLLTAISVKDDRKPLKELFREYERRGVFFDRYSKELIVELFDKLNVIEKISDSGDAQYVKPIL